MLNSKTVVGIPKIESFNKYDGRIARHAKIASWGRSKARKKSRERKRQINIGSDKVIMDLNLKLKYQSSKLQLKSQKF